LAAGFLKNLNMKKYQCDYITGEIREHEIERATATHYFTTAGQRFVKHCRTYRFCHTRLEAAHHLLEYFSNEKTRLKLRLSKLDRMISQFEEFEIYVI
jgi:hypothetical protein